MVGRLLAHLLGSLTALALVAIVAAGSRGPLPGRGEDAGALDLVAAFGAVEICGNEPEGGADPTPCLSCILAHALLPTRFCGERLALVAPGGRASLPAPSEAAAAHVPRTPPARGPPPFPSANV